MAGTATGRRPVAPPSKSRWDCSPHGHLGSREESGWYRVTRIYQVGGLLFIELRDGLIRDPGEYTGVAGQRPLSKPLLLREERLFGPAEYLYGISRIPYKARRSAWKSLRDYERECPHWVEARVTDY